VPTRACTRPGCRSVPQPSKSGGGIRVEKKEQGNWEWFVRARLGVFWGLGRGAELKKVWLLDALAGGLDGDE
jgi:hypothetical protein